MSEADTFSTRIQAASQQLAIRSSNTGAARIATPNISSSTWSSKDNGFREGDHLLSDCKREHQKQKAEYIPSRDFHLTMNASSVPSTSSSLSASHDYSGYSYPTSTSPFPSTAYNSQASYYYGYQHQASSFSYPPHAGAHETSGAPIQTYTSSFQSPGSYVGPSGYSGTYYNTGDYQTISGGYDGGSYIGQTNMWQDGSYGNYTQHYQNYASSDSAGINSHNSSALTNAAGNSQQHFNQWIDFYRQSTDVTCAPGTENISVSASTTASIECSVPGTGGAYMSSTSLPLPSGASLTVDSSLGGLPSNQATVTACQQGCSWKDASSGFLSMELIQPPYFTKPPESGVTLYENYVDRQTPACPPIADRYPPPQTLNQSRCPMQNQHMPFRPSTLPDVDRVGKVHIPTNPRIAAASVLGVAKVDTAANPACRPAYVGVSAPNIDHKASSTSSTDAVLKAGMFPSSLRAYVERALARCKDDAQKAACQTIMKEMITKASADGTLLTRNWDIEPLFPLPSSDSTSKDMPKYKRSPSRRLKSRWEPLPEEKLGDTPSDKYDPIRDVTWENCNGREKLAECGKSETKDQNASQVKLISQPNLQTTPQMQVKKPRLGFVSNDAVENGIASGDSDKDDLVAYSAAAINLANSPEERKKRENRFKRFEEGHKMKSIRPKNVAFERIYSRRNTEFVVSMNFEDASNRAVEDIDWDALTVRGTCQDIEKRYLRLTSAPDPSTVRPEEVLEKALVMVQNCQRNYFYMCDQLKSIRQDLTVQRIRNYFTVKVYETHARLALEAGDLGEYNQCQSQLKSLYAEGIEGCHMEFSAYHLLCVILHSDNKRDLLSSMAMLSADAKKDIAVRHALSVRAAVSAGNYIIFFRLYKSAPNLNSCLMDLYAEKMRFEAMKCMSRSYRPSVPVTFIAKVLGFSTITTIKGGDEKDIDGLEECKEWLKGHGACLIVDNNGDLQVDTKITSSNLYMPEPEDAVAHGDASLAVNDFLARAP